MATANGLLILTLAAGSGGGVTDNKQLSTARINCKGFMVRARSTNTGNIRLAPVTVNSQTQAVTAPATNPLTDATALVFAPGNGLMFELNSDSNRRGEDYNLANYYIQGPNANDVLEVVYEFIAPC